MEVSVALDGRLDSSRLLVLAVSNTGLATTSSEWRSTGQWHRLLPAGHLYDTPGTDFLVLSEAALTKHNGVSITRICLYKRMRDVARLCINTTPGGLKCTQSPIEMAVGDVTAKIVVRLEAGLCARLVKTPPKESKLKHKRPIEGDNVKLGYRIGCNSNQSYGRWAAASYRDQQHGVDGRLSLVRFGRQAELAALLFGCNIAEKNISNARLCELAAQVCTMPLRAHGVYISDKDVHSRGTDRPTMPFFGEAGRFAAFDCEDAAMFVVSQAAQLTSLLGFTEVDDKTLADTLVEGSCNPATVDNVVRILRLAAAYIPLHIVVGRPDSSILHVAVLMVSSAHLPSLFGNDWKRAVPRSRVKFLSKASQPPRFVDACNLLGDVAVAGFGKDRLTRDKRFAHTLAHSDKLYGDLVVAGIFGARVGVNLEGRNRAIRVQLATLLETLGSARKPDSWQTFTYHGPGALTLLPGPDLPVDQLSRKPVPVSPESPDRPARVVMTRQPDEQRTYDLLLFDGLPVVGMIYET
jgi:hypothetical protein